MGIRNVTSSIVSAGAGGLDFGAEKGTDLLESLTDTFFTDLVCEGPIGGFCDQNGDLIQLNYIDESSGKTAAQIEEHNKNENLKLLQAFYANGTPLMDNLGKINFDKIHFDYSLGGGEKVPGTAIGDPTFYNPNIVYPKKSLLIGPRPAGGGGNEAVGGYITTSKAHTAFYYGDDSRVRGGVAVWQNANFANASTIAQSKGASPVFHTISSPWIKNISLTFALNQLFRAEDNGTNHAHLALVSIRIKNEGEDWVSAYPSWKNGAHYQQNIDNTALNLKGKVPNYSTKNIWFSAGAGTVASPRTSGDEILHIWGLSTSPFKFDIPLELPPNPRGVKRTIEITKITHERKPNSKHTVAGVGEMGGKMLKSSIGIESITEINPFKFNYPNSAVITSRYNSESFSSAPERTWHLKLKKVKVPSNYTPKSRSYNGFWDGTFSKGLHWTDNPAWIFQDLMTNPIYGLGKFGIVPYNIDKWALYKIAKYCDELVRNGYEGFYKDRSFAIEPTNRRAINVALTAGYTAADFLTEFNHPQGKLAIFDKSNNEGGEYVTIISASTDGSTGVIQTQEMFDGDLTGKCSLEVGGGYQVLEPRFSCNVYITQRAEAIKLLNDLSSVFHGMMYWAEGKISLTHDAPKSPVAMFNNSNVAEGRFEYSGSAKSARFSVVKVAYIDGLDNFTRKIEYVEDPESIIKFGYLEKEVTAFGCSSRGQAHRLAKWILYTDRFESEVITFQAGIEAAILRPGDVIKIADKNRTIKRLGGRLLNVEPTEAKLYLDSELDFNVIDSKISIITPRASETDKTLYLKGRPSDDDIDNKNSAQISSFKVVAQDSTNKILTVALTEEDADRDLTKLLINCPSNSIWSLETEDEVIGAKPKHYRVIGISEADGQAYGIVASEYNEDKFKALESDIALEKNVLPPEHTDPQFYSLQSPDPPTPPLELSRVYDVSIPHSTILSGDWTGPSRFPLDSNGLPDGQVDYVVDYHYKGNFKSRHRVQGARSDAEVSANTFSDTLYVGEDYGHYTVNVFTEYNGVKSRNFITNSIEIPITGDFKGYEIARATFSQNSAAFERHPAGMETLGEISDRHVQFSWQVKDARLNNVYLDEDSLFNYNKWATTTIKHFNLELLDESDSLIQGVNGLRATRYDFDLGTGIMGDSRIAKLKIVSVAPSGNGEVLSTGYISGKNYAPELTDTTAVFAGNELTLTTDCADADFENILVYATGLDETQELAGGDFAISDAGLVSQADEGSRFTNTGVFVQDLNKTYYYKLLPVDSFGTGVLHPLTGADGGLLAFNRELKIADLQSFADEKGNFNFSWDVKNSIGESVDIASYSAYNDDIELGGFQIELRDDNNEVNVSEKTLDNIKFIRDTGTPGVLNKILIAKEYNKDGAGRPNESLVKFFTKDVPYRSNLPASQNTFTLTNFESGGSPSAGAPASLTTQLNRTQHGQSTQLGVRAFSYELSDDLAEKVVSGDILYQKTLPHTVIPSNANQASFQLSREDNNNIYSAVHSGGFKLVNVTGDNLQVTGVNKSVRQAASGKRSIDFAVKLLDSNYLPISSGRITGLDPAPRISSTIDFDPVTSPGNIIFRNVDYLPGLEEDTIKRVDIYTGDSTDVALDEEHFAFSIDGPFGGNSEKPLSSVTSDPNVIVHFGVTRGATRSTPYYYNFLPYDQFGSGIAKKNVYAYVIDPKKYFESFDFTPPTAVSEVVVDGGYGSNFFVKWSDGVADDVEDERNKDIDHYEVWQGTQRPIGTTQESGLEAGGSAFSNQNFVHYTANYTELVENTDPSGSITNANLVATAKDRNATISNTGDLGWFWVRSVDKEGNRSEFYPSETGEFNRDRTVPEPPTSLSLDGAFDNFFLDWGGSPSPDVKEYEIWKSTGQYLQSGDVDITDNSTNTGVLYLDSNNNIAGDPWLTGYQGLIGTVPYPATFTTITGIRQETAYFWIRAVDKQNNKSSFTNSVTGVQESLGTVGTTDIDDFAIDASKTFTNIPVVSGDAWTDGVSTTGVSWNPHKIYFSGVGYDISAGNTANRYIYWEKPNEYYSTSSGHPGETLTDTDFIIATNVTGRHDLAWNAIANQVIGSAFIQDAAIERAKIAELAVDNARIADLYANKIRTETISGQTITIGPSGGTPGSIQSENFSAAASGFALSGDGTLHLKGSSDSYLKFANNRLELLGTFVNSNTSATLDSKNADPDGTIATFIGGGYNNDIDAQVGGSGIASAIVAGGKNFIQGRYTTIAGGIGNSGYSNYSFIGGGINNCIGKTVFSTLLESAAGYGVNEGGSVIGGGYDNYVGGFNYATVLAGTHNCISGNNLNIAGYPISAGASILAGRYNCILGPTGENISDIVAGTEASSDYSTIAGGEYGMICASTGAFIGQGFANKIKLSDYSTVLGGKYNEISGVAGQYVNINTILNGFGNCIKTNNDATLGMTILNGQYNTGVNSCYSTILGGSNNVTCNGLFNLSFGQCTCTNGKGNVVFADFDSSRTSYVENQPDCNSITFHFCCGAWFCDTNIVAPWVTAAQVTGTNCVVGSCLKSAGGIYAEGDIVACSDARGKSEVAKITNPLNKVNRLCGVTYCTKQASRSMGFLAQDVAPIVPEVVYSGVSGEEYGLKYQNITALLVEAIKEQNKKITKLENRLKDQP